jgi:hypothetical protein
MGVNRRQSLKLLGGGLGSVALALVGRSDASAKASCSTDADCVGKKKTVCGYKGRCINPIFCDPEQNPDCPDCFTPSCDVASGNWTCTSPICENGCDRNPMTCGCDESVPGAPYCALTDACAPVSCSNGQFFDLSTCTCRCPNGKTECGGVCVDTTTNPNNCGSCGNVCPNGGSCDAGICSCASLCLDACCPNGYACLTIYDGIHPVCCNNTGTSCVCPAGYALCPGTGLCYKGGC